jgi:hypothetical protein
MQAGHNKLAGRSVVWHRVTDWVLSKTVGLSCGLAKMVPAFRTLLIRQALCVICVYMCAAAQTVSLCPSTVLSKSHSKQKVTKGLLGSNVLTCLSLCLGLRLAHASH